MRLPELRGKLAGSLMFALSIAVATAITIVLGQFEFHAIEAALYDLRSSSPTAPRPDPRIVLVTIDDSSLDHFKELGPLSVRTHAKLLQAISVHRPRAVGYVLNLARSASLEPESVRTESLREFTHVARNLEQAGTPVVLGTTYDVTGEILPPYPLSTLPHGLALIHRDGAGFSGDKVSRRALLRLDQRPSFPMVLAARAGLRPLKGAVRGAFEVPEVQGRYFSFRYHGDPSTSYPRIPAQSLLDGGQGPLGIGPLLKDRIVLIGTTLHDEPSDFAVTPHSQEPWASPRLALHAAVLDSLLANDGLLRTDPRVRGLLTFLATTGVGVLVLRLSPLMGVLSTLGLGLVWMLAGFALFHMPFGIWLPMAHPFLGMLAAYYLAVPYRLLQEHQQRSRLQRRNEILMQVEELKTNFLSLVTHDLKTPVARIQGLAEVLLSKAAERLVPRDIQSLHHIIQSTDELNRFITSILELAKIESAELRPRLESKDLNQLVERAVDTFKAPARARSCRLETELEPLFPIRLDPSLIQKVIHNLIDNAIKYSPTGSTIRITTREVEGVVEFAISDRGVGLTREEQEQLFQKFYRAKNSATSEVGGSGLGLYLCRYFIEAHQGSIEVSSSPGEGSIFKFVLPLEQAPGLRLDFNATENSIDVQGTRS
jgi:signal transduction histidine kinase